MEENGFYYPNIKKDVALDYSTIPTRSINERKEAEQWNVHFSVGASWQLARHWHGLSLTWLKEK